MKGWCEKYMPQKTGDVVGQGLGVSKLVSALNVGKATFLHGPIGVGKTCSVHALAKEKDYDLIEVNASDIRNSDQINRIVGEALHHGSLFGRGKILLIDEVEGLYGAEDRGGFQAIDKILANSRSKNFVVLTANDPWDKKLNSIRKKANLIEYKKLGISDLMKLLTNICEKENIDVDKEVIRNVSIRSGGDARAAIMDLQAISVGKKSVVLEDLEVLGEREKEDGIFEVIRLVFKSNKLEDVVGAFDNLTMDVDEIFLWLEANMPLEYSKEDLFRGFEALSKANVFYGRIRRWQHWRFLVYVYFLLSCGVALAKDKPKGGFTPYKRSMRPLKIWMSNQKNFKRKAIAERLGPRLHTSKKKFIKEDFPYLRVLAKQKKLPNLDFTDEEVEWLVK